MPRKINPDDETRLRSTTPVPLIGDTEAMQLGGGADAPTTLGTPSPQEPPDEPTRLGTDAPTPSPADSDVTQLIGGTDAPTAPRTSATGGNPEEVTRLGAPTPGLSAGDSDATRLIGANHAPTASSSAPASGARSGLSAVRDPGLTGGAPGTIVPGGHGEGPIAPGYAFGARYHIVSVIGVGGMGAVYRAWDQELGVLVALKVVRPEVASDPETARALERRFKQELLLARKVTHRNVVRIHDLGEVEGIKYITMPFIEGEDLSAVLKREGALPLSTVMPIARTMVEGLVAAHEAGIVHRDLKPANIMINSAGEALIMDFGVARSAEPSDTLGPSLAGVPDAMRAAAVAGVTAAGSIVGTIDYMAPEQARGDAVDQRADIYAFGLILYDVLLGRRRAEHAGSAIAELQERMEKPLPSARSIQPETPEAIDRIIARCVEPDPAKRFQTTAELQAALARLDDNGKPLPIIRRITRRMVVAAAVAVLLLLGGTFYTAKRMSAPPKEHDPVTVVIADFQNNTKDPGLDHTVEPIVRRALEGASFITAYDRTRVRPTFGVRPPDDMNEVAARELAVKHGIGIVVAGSIDPRGGGYEVSIRAIETVTEKIVATARGRAANRDQVLATVTDLVARVRKGLGDETSESAQRFAMRSLSTTSLEVVGHYAAAMEAQTRGRAEEARQSFLKAVELDPTFGLGYQGLAAVSVNLGRRQDAEKYINEALRYLDSMTERERLSVRGLYSVMTGDYQQCVNEYTELIGRYAADTVAHNQLATCRAKLRDMRGAVEAMRQAVAILPKHATYRANLAVLLNYAGDFEAAAQEVQAIPEPDEAATIALAFSQLGRGLVPEAAATYQQLGSMGAVGAYFAASGLGDLSLYEGRFGDAVRILEEGAAADLESDNADGAARKLTSVAHAELSRGQRRRAIVAAEKALSNSTAVDVRFLAARIFVEAEEVDRARKLAAELGSELTLEPQAYGKILDGAIALKSASPREAIKLLSEANAILDTWFGHFELGRAYLEAGGLPQADAEFDRCLKRRGEVLSLFDEDITYGYFPVVYYYQGRVREALKTAAFADSYREYLKIRGNSTDDPLLPDIRARAGSRSTN